VSETPEAEYQRSFELAVGQERTGLGFGCQMTFSVTNLEKLNVVSGAPVLGNQAPFDPRSLIRAAGRSGSSHGPMELAVAFQSRGATYRFRLKAKCHASDLSSPFTCSILRDSLVSSPASSCLAGKEPGTGTRGGCTKLKGGQSTGTSFMHHATFPGEQLTPPQPSPERGYYPSLQPPEWSQDRVVRK
jgi:hypothetical protein